MAQAAEVTDPVQWRVCHYGIWDVGAMSMGGKEGDCVCLAEGLGQEVSP